jgi:hypothetical protein
MSLVKKICSGITTWVLIFTFACKKDIKSDSESSIEQKSKSYHIDNIIGQGFNGGSHATLMVSSLKNTGKFIGVGKINYSDGFRLMQIDRKSGIDWMNTYLSENIDPQIVTCSEIDAEENIWIGGYNQFNSINGFAKPLLAKLDKNGNVLFSKYFPKSISQFSLLTLFGTSLKVLSNSDILFLSTGSTTMELTRLSKTGEVIWNKRLSSDIETSGGSANANRMLETNQGDIFLLSSERQQNQNSEGLHLYKLDLQGHVLFSKNYQFAPFDSDSDIKIFQLQSTELLLIGHRYFSGKVIPFMIKVNPENGKVIGGIIFDKSYQNNYPVKITNMVEFEDYLLVNCIVDWEYDVLKFDKNLSLISSVKTLRKSDGSISTGVMVHDKTEKSLYHFIDDAGPEGGTGFQLLKTDEAGTSCHVFTKQPFVIGFTPLLITELNVARSFIEIAAPNYPFSWKKTEMSDHKANTVCQ